MALEWPELDQIGHCKVRWLPRTTHKQNLTSFCSKNVVPPPCGAARPGSRDTGDGARTEKQRITNHIRQSLYMPATLREVGPLTTTMREAPIYHHNAKRNVMDNNSRLALYIKELLPSAAQVYPKGHTSQQLKQSTPQLQKE